jgi:uncharacterized protein involved in outer membrane biogenesis
VKKLLKWLFRLVLLLAVALGLALLFRNAIAQALLEREIRRQTGMEVFVGNVHLGLASPILEIENLRLFNPPDFDRGTFADLPELAFEYDRGALMQGQLRFRAMRLNLFEVHFVRNQAGVVNLQTIRERSLQHGATPRSRWDLEFVGIDTLSLTLGRLKYTDHKDPSKSDEVWLGVRDARVKDVKSLQDLEPFLVKLALEKNLKPVLDQVLSPPKKAAGRPLATPGTLTPPTEAESVRR